jgi:BirA family biotin operon repressor/biotin-[acetyl-CoA-carboxylase] ligase
MVEARHVHLARVGSTLSEAWSMIDWGERAPFWLTADEQTQGRGRMDRHWVSAPGNLYSTFVGPPPPLASLSLLPFAVSLAVRDALVEHLPEARQDAVTLKWPNDVLDRWSQDVRHSHRVPVLKGSGAPLMAIGIGINIEHAPDILGRATTCLAREGSQATAGSLFSSLRHALARRLEKLESDFEGIIPAWMRKATGMGGPIEVQNGAEIVEGTFDHLASDGALMIRLASGAIRTIRTGDIVIKPR